MTLRQPWASLVMIGAKRFETRSWRTSHRGVMAIHASAVMNHEQRIYASSGPWRAALVGAGIDPRQLPLGLVLGVVDLRDCVLITPELRAIQDRTELAFGDFSDGRWAWELEGPVPFEKPLPAKGHLHLWDWLP